MNHRWPCVAEVMTMMSFLFILTPGVYLCRHADVISKKPLPLNSLGYLIVFKVIKVCMPIIF